MSFRRLLALSIVFSIVAGTAGMATAAQVPVVVAEGPAAPVPNVDGTGLCVATKVWAAPASSLPQTADTFASGMNAFFAANPQSQTMAVHRAPFDLSNNLNDGRTMSYGDFVGVACSQTGQGGCPFVITDPTTAFGTRARGFLRVTAASVGHPIHFGVYVDDAMSLTVFDGAGKAHAALVRPPQLGVPTWRVTNAVTFSSPGLYPVEILSAQITEHAALEISTFEGTFTDFERAANQAPVVNLRSSGFTLLDSTDLFQSEEGSPSFPELERCQQCDRELAGKPGNGGCSAGSHCNAAALCSPCVTSMFCGPSCSPCEDGAKCSSVDGGFRCVAVPADAGTDGGPDAASPIDGGTNVRPDPERPDGSTVDVLAAPAGAGGCGCRQARGAVPSGGVFATIAVALGVFGRRCARPATFSARRCPRRSRR